MIAAQQQTSALRYQSLPRVLPCEARRATHLSGIPIVAEPWNKMGRPTCQCQMGRGSARGDFYSSRQRGLRFRNQRFRCGLLSHEQVTAACRSSRAERPKRSKRSRYARWIKVTILTSLGHGRWSASANWPAKKQQVSTRAQFSDRNDEVRPTLPILRTSRIR